MYAIGMDVGGTNLKAGLVREDGTILRTAHRPLQFRTGEDFAETLAELGTEVMGEVPLREIAFAGIGIPGAVDGGTVLYAENIPLRDLPLEKLFRRYLDLPVFLANDADCAAAGEYLCGCGRGTRNFVLVTLGTGIGGGLILGGKLYRGRCCAGEVGCMVIDGTSGSWETFGSATGLIHLAETARASAPDSRLWQEKLNGQTIFEAAQQQDAAALEAVREYVRCLGVGLTNLADLLMPDRIAIGGGVSAAPEQLLLEPVRKYVNEHCYSRNVGRYTPIFTAELGNDAGIVGAALIQRLM